MLITCVVNVPDNARLWFDNGNEIRKLKVKNTKIMSVSKNVFNITDLTKREKGQYICEVRNQKKVPAIKGKTFYRGKGSTVIGIIIKKEDTFIGF